MTKENLLTQNTLPHIRSVSLQLYKDFAVEILLKRKFHYYFNDGTDIILEFREWGIYHMLAMQHIDNRIGKNRFFNRIDNGLELCDFEKNAAVKIRYKKYKERIQAFACLYYLLENGTVFYIPDSKVPNTKEVKLDYILLSIISNKGINIGLRNVGNVYVPITILISKISKPLKYVDGAEYKLVKRLEILDENDNIINSKSFVLTIKNKQKNL